MRYEAVDAVLDGTVKSLFCRAGVSPILGLVTLQD